MVNKITKSEFVKLGLKVGDKVQAVDSELETEPTICTIESIFWTQDGSRCSISLNDAHGYGQFEVDCVVDGVWYNSENI